jgi:hypothetical protein
MRFQTSLGTINIMHYERKTENEQSKRRDPAPQSIQPAPVTPTSPNAACPAFTRQTLKLSGVVTW